MEGTVSTSVAASAVLTFERQPPPRAQVFRSDHDGTFPYFTGKAGAANERWVFGMAACDHDNDAWSTAPTAG
jgi:hypothetical protein